MSTLNQGLGVKAGGAGGGGSDTNLGNTDLTADAARIYKNASGQTLTFKNNAGTNALQVDNSANVQIGGASPYTMPNARGTANEVLGLTDGTGTAAWRTVTDTLTTYPAQDAGSGASGAITAVANTLYIPEKDRLRMLAVGTTTSTTIDLTNAYLYTPFRNIGSTNLGIGGFISIKFYASALDTYQIWVVKATMTTGTAIATVPCTLHLLGSIEIDGRAAGQINEFQCEEFALSSASPALTSSGCSNYYVVVVPRTAQSTSFVLDAMYSPGNAITRVYS